MSMEFWDKLKDVPDWAKKPIKAGRLKGKTDINPQWRLKIMTEVFGVCGIGWKYKVDKKWIEEGSDGTRCAFVDVLVYIKAEDGWSDPIPGTGGSMLVAKETNGLYTSDEAFKMATTDALSVAFKQIGVGAEVYYGSDVIKTDSQEPINDQQVADIYSLQTEKNLSDADFYKRLERKFKTEKVESLTFDQGNALIKALGNIE